jgi:hypothetical protein
VADPLTELFETTLTKLHSCLTAAGIPYMVVGGVAVLVHGVPRVTRDIDVTVQATPERAGAVLDALPGFRSLVEDPAAFAAETRALPVEGPDGTRVDLIFASLPFEEDAIERAREETLGTARVRVCAPEDLIVMKIISERPRDIEDVAGIVASNVTSIDRARLDPLIVGLALDLERPEILEAWRRITSDG